MSEIKDFKPLTPQLGVSGSSYQLQMGLVGEFWAIRLVKGKSVLDSKVFKDETEIPNGNKLTGWVLSALVLPNINTYQIQKTVGFIRQKAVSNYADMKRRKESAGKDESKDVKLEKVPEGAQIKRPQSKGWVKDDDKSVEISKELAAQSPALAASNQTALGKPVISKSGRELAAIPRGQDFVSKRPEPTPAAEPKAAAVKSEVSSKSAPVEKSAPTVVADDGKEDTLAELIKRVDALEAENKSLKERLDKLEK